MTDLSEAACAARSSQAYPGRRRTAESGYYEVIYQSLAEEASTVDARRGRLVG